MDNDGVVLEQGLDLQKLMAGGAEFSVDQAFRGPKNKYDPMLDDGVFDWEKEDSDKEDELPQMPVNISKNLAIESPEYASFEDLSQKMVDVLPSGDIKMLLISESVGPLIPDGARVWIHYALYWEKEKSAFDLSLMNRKISSEPAQFILGAGKLLPAIEMCIQSLRGPQASAQFLLTHKVTWGELGHPPRIPGGKTCLLCLRVMDVQDIGAVHRFEQLDDSEKEDYTKAMEAYEKGNSDAKDHFLKHRYNPAIKMYHRCLKFLRFCIPNNAEETKIVSETIVKTLINLAVCYNKLEMSDKAILMINELGNVTSLFSNGKALYQYAFAHEALGELDEAFSYYKMALKISPMNSEIANKLFRLQELMSSYRDSETSMWKAAFKCEKKTDIKKLDQESDEFIKEACARIASGDRSRCEVPPGLCVDAVRSIVNGYEGLTLSEETEDRSVIGIRYTIVKC